MTITDDELDRLEALAQAATPGPWERRFHDQNEVETRDGIRVATFNEARRDTWHNARFISAARAAVPALVAEVRRLRDEHKDCDAQLDGAMSALATATANPDWTAVSPQVREQVRGEMDALRAENERLRGDVARLNAHVESLVQIGYEANREWPERCALLAGESAELRASLADAVGKIAAMEPLLQRCAQVIQAVAPDHEVLGDVDAYEASLTAKETP